MSIVKKLLAVMLCLAFVLTVVACGGTSDGDKDSSTAANTTGDATDPDNQEQDTSVVVETQVVTDASGQVVTDANGQQVTQQVTHVVTNANQATTRVTSTRPSATKGTYGIISQAPTVKPGESAVLDPIIRTTNAKTKKPTDAFIKSLNGYKLNIVCAWAVNADPTTEIGERTLYCIQQVQETYGVTINYTGFWSGYNESVQAMLAARNCTDQIYMAQNTYFGTYFKNGYMADLTTGMTESGVDFKAPWYNADATNFLNINYKQIGWLSYDSDYTFPYGIIYNRTKIEKAKLTDPQKLASEGKWTWDTFISYAKALKTSGDVIPFATQNVGNVLSSMCASYGVKLTNVATGTAPTPNINNQSVKDCLATLCGWVKDGYLDTLAGQAWDYPKNQFILGSIVMLYGTHDEIQLLPQAKIDDEFAYVAFPMKDEATIKSKGYVSIGMPQFIWFVPIQYQSQAAKIIFIRDEFYRQSYRYSAADFGSAWKKYFVNGSTASNEATIEYCCNVKYALGNFTSSFEWKNIVESGMPSDANTGSIITYAIEQNGAVQTAIDKYLSAVKTSYNDLWGKNVITGRVSG